MINTLTKVLPVVIILLSGCKSNVGRSFKIINDLISEYNFGSVEMSWTDTSSSFTLQDLNHDELSIEELQSFSTRVDSFLTDKYPSIDTLDIRKYIFSNGGGFEIVEFTFNSRGELSNLKEY